MTHSTSGYCDCACRDCFEIAISDDGKPALCNVCEEAGCDCGDSECRSESAYGGDDTDPDDDGSVRDEVPEELYLESLGRGPSDREDFHSDG